MILRRETLAWLKQQPLMLLPLYTGGRSWALPRCMVSPRNAAFFVGALADLQEMLPGEKLPLDFQPQCDYLPGASLSAHALRGKQVVVHNRWTGLHEIFAYNLYPGPSAKKGVYGVLIHQGERRAGSRPMLDRPGGDAL